MRKIILVLMVLSLFLFTGCENFDIGNLSDEDLERIAEKAIVCEKPYIRHASACCLDTDDNKICDADERELTDDEESEEKEINEKKKIEKKEKTEVKSEEKHEEKDDDGKDDDDEKYYDYDCDNEIDLEGEVDDDEEIYLKWTPYRCEDFKAYKVVWSDEIEFPKYPENSYIHVISNMDEHYMEDKIRGKMNYYSITVLTKDDKFYSNPIKLVVEDIVEETQPDYEPELDYELEDGIITLKWDKYKGSDLSYYKVVWSQENKNLMYPEDDYIEVITDRTQTTYEVPAKKYKDGINYYRISAILDDFYPTKDESQRINSNVLKIEK